jgi:hypothetical protein
MKISRLLFVITIVPLFLGGCNYSIASVASIDPDIIRVNRPIRLKPTCLVKEPTHIDLIEVINIETQEAKTIKPIFNADGLFWTPTHDLNGRYRFRYTCNGRRCYSPAFVVDGALSITGKPNRYPQEDTSSLP